MNQNGKTDRYKYDAIEYYQFDLDWFAFGFIFLAIDGLTIYLCKTSQLYAPAALDHGSGQMIVVLFCTRVFLMTFMSDIRDEFRAIISYSKIVWAILFATYGGVYYFDMTGKNSDEYKTLHGIVKMDMTMFML